MGAADIAANGLIGAVLILSLALAGLALSAWRYARDRRVLLLGMAFSVSTLKALVLGYGLFFVPEWHRLLVPSLGFDLLMLLLLYFASLR